MTLTRIIDRLEDAWDKESTITWMFGDIENIPRAKAILSAIDICRSLMGKEEYAKFAGIEE